MAAPTPPVELGYFTIAVKDLKKAEAFFGAIFGWRTDAAHSHATYAHVGNTKLPFGFRQCGPEEAPSDLSDFYFNVPDVEATLAAIAANGGSSEPPFSSKSGRGALCRDDQGTVFSIWRPAPGF